ncbi:hypothetical protein [Ensifer sp. OV372]|uniref:hypothetical protein n=1 Tax=Ensifer sp. OV372 TaxID=1855293 RepID=UPI0008EB9AD2|nr:hypothetical protein [Ensifer sp. OV372]SFG87742.1 hypothetical protein SAMN05216459_11122 [Ensifer sp. OV372]
MSVSKEAIEAGLRITLSSVNMPAGECLHETDVREILEAALPFLPIAGEAPEGWQLVPKEPTVAMRMPWKTMRGDAWYDKYKAMLAAAPAPPSSPGKDGGQEVETLDARMKAAGMYTVAEMMGITPLTHWNVHSGMNNLDFFGEWLDRKVSEYLRMKAGYELGDKDKGDELYEWVLAHAGAFSTIRENFRAAREGDTQPASTALVERLKERGQAFANQVRLITHLLHGQAYSTTVAELNAFDAALSASQSTSMEGEK